MHAQTGLLLVFSSSSEVYGSVRVRRSADELGGALLRFHRRILGSGRKISWVQQGKARQDPISCLLSISFPLYHPRLPTTPHSSCPGSQSKQSLPFNHKSECSSALLQTQSSPSSSTPNSGLNSASSSPTSPPASSCSRSFASSTLTLASAM